MQKRADIAVVTFIVLQVTRTQNVSFTIRFLLYLHHIGRAKRKGAIEHAQNKRSHIILNMCYVSSHLCSPFIHSAL